MGKVITSRAGDFLLFEASLPHLWRNPYDLPAEFILDPANPWGEA